MGRVLNFYRGLGEAAKKPYRAGVTFSVLIFVVGTLLITGEALTYTLQVTRTGVITSNHSRYAPFMHDLSIRDTVAGKFLTGFYLSLPAKTFHRWHESGLQTRPTLCGCSKHLCKPDTVANFLGWRSYRFGNLDVLSIKGYKPERANWYEVILVIMQDVGRFFCLAVQLIAPAGIT
jgi:hypothetical protein